ncbi:MAG: hypothetical protein PHO24_07060 [Clostridia bacterium]|nr:hypothetical protein [Clostridia bacterium]
MKKILVALAAFMLLFAFTACGEQAPVERPEGAPALPEAAAERGVLNIYLDGEALAEGGFAAADVEGALHDVALDGTYYYAATCAEISGADLSAACGAFVEAADGYVSYLADPSLFYVAAYQASADGAAYEPIADGYNAVAAGAKPNKGIVNIYLVTTPAEFAVDIQVNGASQGTLTMTEFMQKTPLGEDKLPTAFFDGSHYYDGGAATYEGRFFGISYEQMLAKLAAMGIAIDGEIAEAEMIGYKATGGDEAAKNTEYSTDPTNEKYFGLVSFFCMYDGKTTSFFNPDQPVGLTSMISGTGGRWMTYNLQTINFITK